MVCLVRIQKRFLSGQVELRCIQTVMLWLDTDTAQMSKSLTEMENQSMYRIMAAMAIFMMITMGLYILMDRCIHLEDHYLMMKSRLIVLWIYVL